VIEHIHYGDSLLALIVPRTFKKPGVNFVTPPDLSQQLAYMCHPAGKIIDAHFHNPVPREVHYSQEVLFIRKGRLRVDFYDEDSHYVESRILEAGDTILLITGGHGFEVLNDVEMIEVKQGPHVGEGDKTRFPGISAENVRLSTQK
jgi:mannose-6-phosphate isomerase-like protein (cupin superfamily)